MKCLEQTPTIYYSSMTIKRKMQINWESFVIVRDKKFHVEIRVFLVTCLFDLILCNVSFGFSKQDLSLSFNFLRIISTNDEKSNLKLSFFKRLLLKDVYFDLYCDLII